MYFLLHFCIFYNTYVKHKLCIVAPTISPLTVNRVTHRKGWSTHTLSYLHAVPSLIAAWCKYTQMTSKMVTGDSPTPSSPSSTNTVYFTCIMKFSVEDHYSDPHHVVS